MSDYTPAEIIIQARQKARTAIINTCGEEIKRICDAFFYETGLDVRRVEFISYKSTTIEGQSDNILCEVNIDHEGI